MTSRRWRFPAWAAAGVALATVLSPAAGAPAAPPFAPEVRVVGSEPSVEPVAAELARTAPEVMRRVEERTGLRLRASVTVVIAPTLPADREARARLGVAAVPSWAAGVAQPRYGRMVIFLDRARGYPHRDVAGVLAHESSHLLLAQALAPGTAVPRWYDEGLATAIERGASLRDAVELARLVVLKPPVPFARLEREWPRGAIEARAAYAQSFSFVAHVEDASVPGGAGRLAAAMAGGRRFDDAFEIAYGLPPSAFESTWRRELRFRLVTLPLIVAGATINVVIGLLIVVAYGSAKLRRRRILREWEEEERFLEPGGPSRRFDSR